MTDIAMLIACQPVTNQGQHTDSLVLRDGGLEHSQCHITPTYIFTLV
jgi:hypothetical protein